MRIRFHAIAAALFVAANLLPVASPTAAAADSAVLESARQIPVAYDVDVVVVGGGSGAVAAAVSAAKSGAKVFLAAPHNYLGEDMAGAMRLYLEEDEKPNSPLAHSIFNAQDSTAGLPFAYAADKLSAAKHKDTDPPTLLNDNQWSNPVNESVQYDDDVNIVIDLGKECGVKKIHAMVFRAKDYNADSMTVSVSNDKRDWRQIGEAKNDNSTATLNTLSLDMAASTRYVKCFFKKSAGATRILIGEILIEPAASPDKAEPKSSSIPMQVKRALDQALTESGVQFLYGCYPADLLVDGQGKPAGVVMANRAGRQAVLAKVIIDATQQAVVARWAGAKFRPFVAGPQNVKWISIAKEAKKESEQVSVRKLPLPVGNTGDAKPSKRQIAFSEKDTFWFEYTLKLDLPDDSWAARANLEQKVRDLAYVPTQLYTADEPFFIYPQTMKANKSASAEWKGADKIELDVFRPEGLTRLWVLGPCADMPREIAEKILRPLAYMETGARIGRESAMEAKAAPALQGVRVARAKAVGAAASGEVKEPLAGMRPGASTGAVPEDEGALPVLGSYDVVVIGGGTAGAPAGISAARQGAHTLLVEYLNALGGVGTTGMIGGYYCGNRVGFTTGIPDNPVEVRMEWYRSELRKAKADIWYGALGCGALVEGNRVKGAIIATPYGRGVVLAKVVIDGTGNSDVAIDAGANYVFVEDDYALQNAHLPSRNLGDSYYNGDRRPVDDADPLNIKAVIEDKLRSGVRTFDLGQLMDTRERRRIVGDFCIDWLDIVNERTFPDSVTYAASNYDSHGYQIHPFFSVTQVSRKIFHAYMPYRCMLPKGMEGILVVGLGISAHRDAMPILRMQPDLHNLGYAAGVAAAWTAKSGAALRQVDIKALQKHLVEIGNLPPTVLTDRDSYPILADKLKAAVGGVKEIYKDAAVIQAEPKNAAPPESGAYKNVALLLAQPKEAAPLLRDAYEKASGQDKLAYAQLLAVMGDGTGASTLIESLKGDSVQEANKSKGWGGKYGMIRALGFARDRRAVPLLVEIAKDKAAISDFQLLRSVTFALGRIGDPAGAAPLADLLSGSGENATRGADAKNGAKTDARSAAQKALSRDSLRDAMIACALYRCGDKDGQAKQWLQNCIQQSDGTLSRLAQLTLNSPRQQ
ncbi:MAG: FAD-dependent oxidoreductase [Candidatus Sumerlaeota bacterium]|nr:FAD-dependent oxidoreductase [Candidatus Sumerlaeota bacterium]